MKDANNRELTAGDLVNMTFKVLAASPDAQMLRLEAVSPVTGGQLDNPPQITCKSEWTLHKHPAE